jgi:hypothetical protein
MTPNGITGWMPFAERTRVVDEDWANVVLRDGNVPALDAEWALWDDQE